jgi:hypothetical protein
MLLTDHERAFLAAFIHEATTDPFTGPATKELHRRDIYYTDLPHLMSAYYRENPPDQEGFGGKRSPTPPPCPWADREAAVRRDREMEAVLDGAAHPDLSAAATWTVRRQDDNGNRFVVQTGLSRDEAERLVAELEARGHKQVYWSEPEQG